MSRFFTSIKINKILHIQNNKKTTDTKFLRVKKCTSQQFLQTRKCS